MKKCALCNWENSESNETLDEFFNGSRITDFELCDSHEHQLKAFCEED